MVSKPPAESEEKRLYHLKLIHNVKLIRDVVRDLRPDSVVLEMCDDRYNRWLSDVVNHPNYDRTIQEIHTALDKKPEKLSEMAGIEIEDSSLEYLIGLDYCSYRLPCKMVLGDRSYQLTRKRFESKKSMLEVYKEAKELAAKQTSASPPKATSSAPSTRASTIFDLDSNQQASNDDYFNKVSKLGLESQVTKLK